MRIPRQHEVGDKRCVNNEQVKVSLNDNYAKKKREGVGKDIEQMVALISSNIAHYAQDQTYRFIAPNIEYRPN